MITNKKLFGTSGIRGDGITFFNKEFTQKIAYSFYLLLKTHFVVKNIAIGMDPRPSSLAIKNHIQEILSRYADIYDEGILPTPALSYFAKTHNLSGAIMITGSHIQENLNGLKFFIGGEEILKDQETKLEQIFYSGELPGWSTLAQKQIIKENKASDVYGQMLVSLISDTFKRKVVVDAGNGTQSEIMPWFFRSIGASVIQINCDNGKPLLSRDTETKDSFIQIQDEVKKTGADLGVLYDSDGDRVIFIDEQGNFLSGEIGCALILKYSSSPGVVTPINTSTVIERIGKKVIRTKVGSPYVIEAMKKNNVDFGFEANGGALSAEIQLTRDAGVTTAKLVNVLISQKLPLSALVAQIPKYYIEKTKIDCPSEKNAEILSSVEDKFKDCTIDRTDGLKVWLDPDSWVLFRPSGNAPEFRIFAESLDKVKTQQLITEALNFIKSILKI